MINQVQSWRERKNNVLIETVTFKVVIYLIFIALMKIQNLNQIQLRLFFFKYIAYIVDSKEALLKQASFLFTTFPSIF